MSTLYFPAAATSCYALVRVALQKGAEITGPEELPHGAPYIGSERKRGIDAMNETSLYHSEPPSFRTQSLAPIGASILRLGTDLLKVRELRAKSPDFHSLSL
jgi:hypothetical protein